MLGKLLKYEVRATARIFLPLYALLILFTGLNRLFLGLNLDQWNHEMKNFAGGMLAETVWGISISLYIIIIVAICIMTLVVTVERFYKNLLGDEGYLMNTLPVTADQQIISKMLVSIMWQVLSLIIGALSIFLLIVNGEFLTNMKEALTEIGRFYAEWGMYASPITFEVIVVTIVCGIKGVITIYAAIMVGSLCSKHRLIASFGVYIGFGVAENIITSIIFSVFGTSTMKWFEAIMEKSPTPSDINTIVQVALIVSIVISIVLGMVYYFVTHHMLDKKLNLE